MGMDAIHTANNASLAAERKRHAMRVDAAIACAEAFEASGHEMLAIEAYREAMSALIQETASDPAIAWLRRRAAPIARLALLLERRRQRSEALQWIDRWRECNDARGVPGVDKQLLMSLEAWMRAGIRAPYPGSTTLPAAA